jgi:hypothetical protein
MSRASTCTGGVLNRHREVEKWNVNQWSSMSSSLALVLLGYLLLAV